MCFGTKVTLPKDWVVSDDMAPASFSYNILLSDVLASSYLNKALPPGMYSLRESECRILHTVEKL